MFTVDSTQPAVFCYGSLSSLVQWVPRCCCCWWSGDHFENHGRRQWKSVKVPAAFLSSFTITDFFFLVDPVFTARKGQPRIIEKPGHSAQEWVPSACLALSFMSFTLLLVEVNSKDFSQSVSSPGGVRGEGKLLARKSNFKIIMERGWTDTTKGLRLLFT